MSQRRWLMLVGAGIESIPGIDRAHQMGLNVVVSDYNGDAPGVNVADHFLNASTYDPDETVAAAVEFNNTQHCISGVMSVGTDVPMTVSAVAKKLGLHGLSPESAKLAADKMAMKERFEKDGVPVPWYTEVASSRALSRIQAIRGVDMVVKPVDSRGGRGVVRLCPGDDPGWAFAQARENSPTGRVMVEEYLDGPQVSTESIILNKTAYTPGFSDRNYKRLEEYAPYFIEDGGELPSHLPGSIRDKVENVVALAANSMGIDNWVAKGDVVIHHGQPYIIEMAARLSGGYFCSHEVPLNTGVDLLGNVIRLAVGDQIDPATLLPRFNRPVVQRYLFPSPGRVLSITGEEEVTQWAGIEMCEIRVCAGDSIPQINAHPARAGVVIATGDTIMEATVLAERAVAHIEIKTKDIL